MLKREEPIAESDCREGRFHKMMTSIRKTVSPDRNDVAAGTAGAPRSVALNARPVPIAMMLLAAIAIGMMLMLPGSPLHAQDSTIEHAENDSGPVATFTAVDPEGRTVYWDLVSATGFTAIDVNGDDDTDDAGDIVAADVADAGDFSISMDGVLSFSSPPNYEDPKGGADETNTYNVVVVSSDDAPGATTDGGTPLDDGTNLPKMSYHKVTVTVTDEDEDGSVSLSALQPQVGIALNTAGTPTDDADDAAHVLKDQDASTAQIDAAKWNWHQAPAMDGPWTLISDETNPTYTPAADVAGAYLRVTATYSDRHDSGKTAMAVSANPVRTAPAGANSPPVFSVGATDTRKVKENSPSGTAVGKPVAAGDDGDILTYTITGTNEGGFSIDRATGQLMVGSGLNREAADFDGTYEVTVRATDPFGDPDQTAVVATNSAAITITITVDNVNEAPRMTAGPTKDSHMELTVDDADTTEVDESVDVGIYTASDVDVGDAISWALMGDDKDVFKVTPDDTDTNATDGVNATLAFKKAPNYEKPADADMDNIYMVTVVASDKKKLTAMRGVVVTVGNANDPGSISFSSVQPKVRIPFMATLSDEDGVVDGSVKWQWYDDNPDDTGDGVVDSADDATRKIAKATTNTYTPKSTDVDGSGGEADTLYVRATYSDGYGSTSEVGMADNPVVDNLDNAAPQFKDVNEKVITATSRSVNENTEAVPSDDAIDNVDGDDIGLPVAATDPNTDDTLTYTLGGTDAALFRVRQGGQLEVGAGTKLDYEKKSSYMVTVTATDPSLASAAIDVTINVDNVNEGPVIAGEDDVTKDFRENSTSVIQTFSATDPERRPVYWSLQTGDSVYSDDSFFTISSRGALSFNVGRDYEDPADAGTDNTYRVIVVASDDASNIGSEYTEAAIASERKFTVRVTDARETGSVTVDRRVPQVGVAVTATLVDGDATATEINDAVWKWYSGSTEIPGATDDNHIPAATGSLKVEATYTAKGDTRKASRTFSVRAAPTNNVAPAFQNDAEARSVDENRANAVVGVPIRATDTDTLTYSVVPSTAFSIDNNGQLRTRDELDSENPPTLSLTVTATDPSALTDSVTITVTINDENEAPRILAGPTKALPWPEDKAITEAVAAYTADDPDGQVQTDNLVWSLSGPDGPDFNIGNQTGGTPGTLTFKESPDYEMPAASNNVYRVTVEVSDGKLKATRSMTVMVTDVEEPGVVTMSSVQPKEAIALTASLKDSDGGVTDITWQWERDGGAADSPTPNCSVATGWVEIDDAEMATYAPANGDIGKCLRATAKYTDRRGETSAMGVSDNSVVDNNDNRAPAFKNQPGSHSVDEGMPAGEVVGQIEATDPNGDKLTYKLTGADAGNFKIAHVDEEGQITTAAKFNHEVKSSYMVTVTATDPNGLMASHAVTINVSDVDEAPVIELGGLAIASGGRSVSYAEDGTGHVAAYTAVGPDAAGAAWTLEGPDAGDFRISSAGVLTFVSPPDYEAPADADTDNAYMVTVKVDDGKNDPATRDVTVMVTNEEEAGTVLLSTDQPQAGVAITASLSDPDGGVTDEEWQWAKSTTIDGVFDDIDGATSASYTPVDADEDYYLMAKVTYTDAEGGGKSEMATAAMAVTITDVDEPVIPHDTNNDGMIDKSEVIAAFRAYVAGDIDKPQIIETFRQYVADAASSQ